jgi:hypothetical protein
MHKIKQWVMPLLMITFLSVTIHAEPITTLVILGSKAVAWGVKASAKAKEVAKDVDAFKRMTEILRQLKIVNEDTNKTIQDFNQQYHDVVSGQAYTDAVRLVYTHDRERTHLLVRDFGSLQSNYTRKDGKPDGINRIHSYAEQKKEKFYSWIDSVIEPTSSDGVQKQNEQDLAQANLMSAKGLDTMNAHQNAMNNTLTAEIADNTRALATIDLSDQIKKQHDQEQKETKKSKQQQRILDSFNTKVDDPSGNFKQFKGWW